MNIAEVFIFAAVLAFCLSILSLPFVRFGKSKPILDRNKVEAKLTLDEMGITLWEASDAHYDAKALKKIRDSHQLEHRLWLNFAGEGHWTDEERKLVGLPKAMRVEPMTADRIEVRNWEGDVVRSSGMTLDQAERIAARAKQINADLDDTFDIWDEDADETLLARDCKNHDRTELCYYCDGSRERNIQATPKRQRRKQ